MDGPSTSWANPFLSVPTVQCFVPKCPSNSLKFPSKLFLSVPREPKLREKWLEAAGNLHVASTSNLRCCEDHFDVQNDIEWPLGSLRNTVVPHIFDCQQRNQTAIFVDLKPKGREIRNMEEAGYPPYQTVMVQEHAPLSDDLPNQCMQTRLNTQETRRCGETVAKVKSESGVKTHRPPPLTGPLAGGALCTTCLAADRTLYSLRHAPQYLTICSGVALSRDDEVCFECRARLEHFMRFKRRALRARRAFAAWTRAIPGSAQSSGLQCLSTLARSTTDPGRAVRVGGDALPLPLPKVEPEDADWPACDQREDDQLKDEAYDRLKDDQLKDEGRKATEEDADSKPDLAAADGDSETDTASETADDVQKEVELYHEDFLVSQLTADEVRAHMQSERASARYKRARHKCAQCALVFYSERHLRMHKPLHSESRGSLKCDLCEQRFKSSQQLKVHSTAHSRRFQCRMCDHVDFNYKRMYEHHRSAHDDTPRRCRLCTEHFTNYTELRKHVRSAHRTEHPCKLCCRSFTSNQILARHMLMAHTKVPEAECAFCHKKYKGEFNLKKHIQDVHETSQRPDENAYCAECDMQFPTVHRYRNHLRHAARHATDQHHKFECDYCGKRCKEKASLRTHIELMHLKIARYKCDVCEESFPTVSYMRRHKRQKHAAVARTKRHVCHLCEKAFTVRKSLDEHMNTHLGIRPFECKLCGATFTYSAALYNHNQLVHLKMKVGRGRNT